MPNPSIAVSYDLWAVALSYFIASFASYVTLDLAKRVRTPDRALAVGWWVGGSMAMGTGVWSMHFVGMLAARLPFDVGFGYAMTALSWVAAVAVSGLALHIAGLARLSQRHLAGGAVAMGAGICLMHYTGMAALDMAPGIRWNGWLIAASVGIAVGASAVALLIFFWLRSLSHAAAQRWQFVAALVMGAAISGMHYTGMAAAGFSEGAVCLSAGQLRGNSLGLLVGIATLVLLSLTLFTAAVDSRMQGQSARLAASLQTANAELQRLVFRDALTGLPNRLLFDDRVATAVDRCLRSNGALAVLFVDLDGFKPINDSFGHAVGDKVLRQIATRIDAELRATDSVARVGGDEFVVLLENLPDSAAAAQLAERLIAACKRPVDGDGHALQLSCSVGIALFPSDGPCDQLMAHADAAMYAAKRAGGASFAFFEPRMNAGTREQIELQRDLRAAIETGALMLHYQPKIGASSGTITGVEALLRWRHPQRGMVPPAVFVPIAERAGLIGALGDWVIHEACRQLRAWLDDDGLRLHMAINLSVHQLRHDGLVQRVAAALAQHRIDASMLTFEITESVAMDDAQGSLRVFENLRALGGILSIDDFGTGYSSLSYLRRLHAGQLKIDRSFVQDLDSSADARAIVEAVVRLAHALGMRVVAEGVETAAQRDVLCHMRCDELQGYLFARPMPAEVLAQWAADVGRPTGVRFALSAFVERPAADGADSAGGAHIQRNVSAPAAAVTAG